MSQRYWYRASWDSPGDQTWASQSGGPGTAYDNWWDDHSVLGGGHSDVASMTLPGSGNSLTFLDGMGGGPSDGPAETITFIDLDATQGYGQIPATVKVGGMYCTVGGGWSFLGDASTAGVVVFQGNSYNGGIVGDFAQFTDAAKNEATIGDHAVFAGQSNNQATTGANTTFAEYATNGYYYVDPFIYQTYLTPGNTGNNTRFLEHSSFVTGSVGTNTTWASDGSIGMSRDSEPTFGDGIVQCTKYAPHIKTWQIRRTDNMGSVTFAFSAKLSLNMFDGNFYFDFTGIPTPSSGVRSVSP